MKIYGLDVSNPTNKVRYVANALGLDYEFEHAMPFSEEVQTDAYKLLHPASKVPALEDDGFKLFESNAIIRYLANKKKSSLYPEDLKQRAKVDQWMDFVTVHVRNAAVRVFFNRIGAKFLKQEVDEKSLECGLKFLDRFLPIVDEQLGKSKYLASDQLTLADFNLLAELDGAEVCDIDLSKYKNLKKWRDELQAQKFYQIDRSQGEAIFEQVLAQK